MKFLGKTNFLYFAILFFAARFLYLYFIHPSGLFFDLEEELYRGFMAKEILEGSPFGFWGYQADSYAGGNLVVAHITSLFFLIFGTQAFALKLTSVLISFLTLWIWFSLIHKNYSEQVADDFALLYIFAPFAFVHYSLGTFGDHMETLLFTGISLYLLFEILYQDNATKKNYFLLGLTCGFGLWFAYIFSVTLATILLYLFIRHRSRLFHHWLLFAIAGFMIGFAPWLKHNLASNFAGFVIHGESIWHHFSFHNLTNLSSLAPYQLLRSFMSDATEAFQWNIGDVFYVTVLSATLILLPKALRGQSFFLILYLFIFCMFAQATDFDRLKYFVVTHPIVFAILAVELPQATKKTGTAFLTLLVLLGAASQVSHVSLKLHGSLFKFPGYSYYNFANAWDYSYFSPCKHLELCAETYNELSERLEPRDLQDFAKGFAYRATEELNRRQLYEQFNRIKDRSHPELLTYYEYYMGTSLNILADPEQRPGLYGLWSAAKNESFNWDCVLSLPQRALEPLFRQFGKELAENQSHATQTLTKIKLSPYLNEDLLGFIEEGQSSFSEIFMHHG